MTQSASELLVLHAVRLQGVVTAGQAAARFDIDPALAQDLLLDDEAYGWVSWSEFAGAGGWSLTERGRKENERQLQVELDAAPGTRRVISAVHEEFLPWNARLQQACTDWQIRPRPGRPMAENDHGDADWEGRILAELDELTVALEAMASRLTRALTRFAGYDVRFAAANQHAAAGDRSAVAGVGHDSCHAVWFELHEDLIATLGLRRGGA